MNKHTYRISTHENCYSGKTKIVCRMDTCNRFERLKVADLDNETSQLFGTEKKILKILCECNFIDKFIKMIDKYFIRDQR